MSEVFGSVAGREDGDFFLSLTTLGDLFFKKKLHLFMKYSAGSSLLSAGFL